MTKRVSQRQWLEIDFRDLPKKSGLPKGWQDTSPCFKTKGSFGIQEAKGARFLHLEATKPGKVQIRFPLKKKLTRETTFRINILARSGSNAGILAGIRPMAQPEQADEVTAAVLLNLTPAWKEHIVTTRGGPVKGPLAFYFNFGTPGQADILYIKVEEVSPAEHKAKIVLPQGHEGHWDGGWLETHQGKRAHAVKHQPKIAYWGDSITAGWLTDGKAAWERDFVPLNIQNFGIGGDTVQSVLWRAIDSRVGQDFSPKLVVIMIGANNLFRIQSPVDIAEAMAVLLKEFRTRLPKAKILMVGVLPSRHSPKDGLRKRIADLNKRYTKLADGKQILFADIGHAIIERDGSILEAVSKDGTHFLEPGYERLAKVLFPKIRALIR